MKKLFFILIIISSILYAMDTKEIIKDTENKQTEDILGKEIVIIEKSDLSTTPLTFDPYGIFLAGSEDNGVIKVWDVFSGKEIVSIKNEDETITALDFSPNSYHLASGSEDGIIKIWNVLFKHEIATLKGHVSRINAVVYSPDGKYLASGSDDGTIRVWDLSINKEKLILRDPNNRELDLCYSHNGKYLAIGRKGTIIIWDLELNKLSKELKGHVDWVSTVSYSIDDKYLVSGSDDNTIKIWETNTGKNVKTIKGHGDWIDSVIFSPDGKYLVVGSNDNVIKVWDIETEKEIITIDNVGTSIEYSPDGKYLASSNDNKIKIWCMIPIKARTRNISSITNDVGETIGALPKDLVTEIDILSANIFKPITGKINSKDFEELVLNEKNQLFFFINDTPIWANSEKTKILTHIEKGKIIDKLYYSKELDTYYINDGFTKGWVESKNIGILNSQYNKVVVGNDFINSFVCINGLIKEKYNSGDILEFSNITLDNQYLYSSYLGWINRKDVISIDESNKNRVIYVNTKESKFNNDFTGDNYKNVLIGTEYILLGTTDKYNLVSSKLTGEKGWILKNEMSFIKPDLNDPVILITNTMVDENNMLKIEGKIYDDTAINSFLLNGNKMSTKPLNTFDKLGYIPEVGYSFSSQWFLIEGMENNVEIKVIDREGKSYSKVLKYTPELKTMNLSDFQIENVVKKLPKLEYSTELKDSNGDNILTGSEKMILTVKVTNGGEGEAKNVVLNINNNSNNNLNYRNSYPLGTIKPNETKIAVIDINGQDNIVNSKALFDLQVNEQNGFNPFPAKFSFNVEPKLNPRLEIIDYAIDDDNKNGQIEQGEKFDLYVLVQNTGEGDSKNTILEVNKKSDGIISMAETSYKYDVVKSGESKKIKFSFVTNYLYKGNGDLPFDINLYNEKDTIKIQKSIVLVMNKVIPTIKEVNLEAKKKEVIVASKISIMSDIDDTSKLIAKTPNPKKWAVVVGVENYKKAPYVEFAERDALVTKEYFNKLLGVPKENTFYLSNSDATYGELKVLLKDKLKNRVAKDDEVYFYFSGHGVPTNDGESYLLLNDSDPSNPKISAYPIKELYEDLGSLKTTKSYAFLDTCFSGGTGRTDKIDTLLEGTRPGVMKVNDISLAYNNLVIFTATDKNQLSNSYKEQNHGLFTYFMLKGLSGGSGKENDISIEELHNYIKENVSKESRKLGQTKNQDPLLKTDVDKKSLIY